MRHRPLPQALLTPNLSVGALATRIGGAGVGAGADGLVLPQPQGLDAAPCRERLRQAHVDAEVAAGLAVGVARDGDDRADVAAEAPRADLLAGKLAIPRGEGVAGHVGQMHVEHDELEVLLAQQPLCGGTVLASGDEAAKLLEEQLGGRHGDRVVLDEQHARPGLRHRLGRGGACEAQAAWDQSLVPRHVRQPLVKDVSKRSQCEGLCEQIVHAGRDELRRD